MRGGNNNINYNWNYICTHAQNVIISLFSIRFRVCSMTHICILISVVFILGRQRNVSIGSCTNTTFGEHNDVCVIKSSIQHAVRWSDCSNHVPPKWHYYIILKKYGCALIWKCFNSFIYFSPFCILSIEVCDGFACLHVFSMWNDICFHFKCCRCRIYRTNVQKDAINNTTHAREYQWWPQSCRHRWMKPKQPVISMSIRCA